tara:strand:- start:85 stop:438 length:354 start_codon:yes stop_codon:yes gene_type:complete
MKKFLYFADGNGANATSEAYVCEASQIKGIFPVSTTTTGIMVHKSDENMDKIVLTHDNKTTTSGHRCKDIAVAIAQAANAGPHTNGMVDIVDLDNSLFYGNLSFVTAVSGVLNENPA